MIRRRLIVFPLLILIYLVITTAVYGSDYYGSDFTTDSFNITIDVKENHKVNVTEEITVTPTYGIRGIFRTIPLRQTIDYKNSDGSLIKTVTSPFKVDHISVPGFKYKAYKEDGNMVIKIGEKDLWLKETTTYNIYYHGTLFDDRIKEYDSFYYNVLPHKWESPINSAKVVVTMPKEFDPNNVKVISGSSYGTESTNKVDWTVSGNSITITTNQPLDQWEGITLAIVLPEGYFSKGLNNNTADLVIFIICLIGSGSMVFIWSRYGRDSKVIKTVEFYPPEGLTSGEIGYVIDGSVDKKDIVSLVVYLADKGYINIEETNEGQFILHRVSAPAPEERKHVRTFYAGLFNSKESRNLNDLPKKFSDTTAAIERNIIKGFAEGSGRELYDRKLTMAMTLGVLTILTSLVIPAVFLSIWTGVEMPKWYLYGLVFISIFFFNSVSSAIKAADRQFVKKILSKGWINVVSLVELAIAIVGTKILYNAYDSNFTFVGPILLEVTGFICLRNMKKRTKYGNEIMGKILGFRDFIERADLNRINLLVEENPSYFYSVLPYAYVLGLSKKWISNFENIQMAPPNWYYGQFDPRIPFNVLHMTNTMTDMSFYMNSHISTTSTGKGFFGGGGGGFSSGGGFGGGGGGSW